MDDEAAYHVRQHLLPPPGAGREHVLHDVEQRVRYAVDVPYEVGERGVPVGPLLEERWHRLLHLTVVHCEGA